MRHAVAALSLVALTACATAPEQMPGPPDYTRIQTQSSPRAALFADCIAEAVAADRYGHAFDEVHVIVFTCEGAAAQAFFDALGPWMTQEGSEASVGDRVIRATTRIERDLFAADYCEREGEAYRCAISLRTGAFAAP